MFSLQPGIRLRTDDKYDAAPAQSQTWSEFSRWTADKPATEVAVRKLRGMSGRMERMDADAAFTVELAQQVSKGLALTFSQSK